VAEPGQLDRHRSPVGGGPGSRYRRRGGSHPQRVTETEPACDPNPDIKPFNLAELPDDNHNALVGSIYARGVPFMVGEQLTFTADSAGVLYPGVNDQRVANNTGSYVAAVTVTPATDG
jgi:hypothetical protein